MNSDSTLHRHAPGTYRLERPLADQRVAVVGGTSGMGRGAVALALEAGASVVSVGRRPLAERPESAAPHPRLSHDIADVEDEASIAALFQRLGELDHLLITAAPPPGSWGPFLQSDLASAQSYLQQKFFGSWACARHAAPHLRAGGSITFLTGGLAVERRAGASIVSATFAALEALGSALAVELGPIRVNTIRPGLVDSEMWNFLEASQRRELRAFAEHTFPARRIGTPDDIGHAAVFLMTNRYVTGTVLEVSGGETLVAPRE
jgi:NAD(P)-dependent dehydrogenase (short-subunit alcohol dehydrogenase family)